MSSFDISTFRARFPTLALTQSIYFDNGATTHKPDAVIDAQTEFYRSQNANVHRSSHRLGAQSTSLFEHVRDRVAQFIHAAHKSEIVWTKGTTEAINLVAATWGEQNIKAGDEIVLSQAEHHANIVPWQQLAQRKGAHLVILPINKDGIIDLQQAKSLINSKTRIVCCAHISNVIGKLNPIKDIIALARNVNATVLIDGAQAIASVGVDVQQLDCDFYVFSAHKMYGPTGLGVLYGKSEILEKMPPYQYGGEMIKTVSFEHTEFNIAPFKFEAGTPNISAVVALQPALDLIEEFKLNRKHLYKTKLIDYAYDAIRQLPFIRMLATGKPDIPLFSFVGDFNVKDLSASLDAANIAVRSGYMCAMPLMAHFNIDGCIRITLAPYNTFEEVDVFVETLQAFHRDEQCQERIPLSLAESQRACDSDTESVTALIKQFKSLKGWDSKHRQIMLFGKSFPRMSESLCNDENLIAGCESAAWLTAELTSDNQMKFQADSQAKVIRGLLHIVFTAYQRKSPRDILTFDVEGYFSELGLVEHLSPSRGNGLRAIVEKIKKLAKKYD